MMTEGQEVTANPPTGSEMCVRGVEAQTEETQEKNVLRLRGGANTFADCLAYLITRKILRLTLVPFSAVSLQRRSWHAVSVSNVVAVAVIVLTSHDPSCLMLR